MEQFGCVEPLVWNEQSGNLVGGHQRFKILLREFGVKEVDVSVVHLTAAKEKALNVALNKIGGEWDETALAELLAGMQSGGELDVAVTGFDLADIDGLIAAQVNSEAVTTDTEAASTRAERHAVLIECSSPIHRRKVFGECKTKGYSCVEAVVGGGYWREAE
jgi:ParB-like chromosome segregation protein Spo0J